MNAPASNHLPMIFAPQIVEYTQTAAALARLQHRFANVVFDVATTEGMKEAKAGRRELRTLRTDLEVLRTELKAPVLERGRLIDAEAKALNAELEKLEKPIDATIKAEEERKERERIEREQAEQKRIAAIQAAISDIRNLPAAAVGKTAGDILQMAEEVDVMPIDPAFYGGYVNEATIARNAAAAKLRQAHVAQLEHEAEQAKLAAERAELERLRAEQAAREAQERIEREAREKAEREARAAQEAAARKERERQEAELRAQREALERQAAELARQRAEIEAQKAAETAAKQPAFAAPVPAGPAPTVSTLVAAQPDLRVVKARAELVQFRANYGDIGELAGVVAAIDQFLS